jgi:phage tail-like protein
VVTVRVQSKRVGGDPVVMEYSFTTEDVTAPRPIAAVSTARRAVQVEFSEAVIGTSATGATDALNPDNWSLSVASTSLDDGLPAVAPEILSITKLSPTIYELVLATEITPGALYEAAVLNVYDLEGNQIVEPVNTVQFYGYRCPAPEGRDFLLFQQVPELNRSEDTTRELEAFMACLQEVTDHLLCDIDEWTDILDPDRAPERFVDAMLADLGNPFAFDLSEIDKRRLAQVLVPIYKQKGTDPGIINAVRFFLGVEVTIRVPAFDGVWVLGESEIGTDSVLGSDDLRTRLSFWVDAPLLLTQEQRDRITGIAEYMKRAETHLLGVAEPGEAPTEPDHWELGFSELGVTTTLH